jgi:hypothetical protein
MDSSTFAGSFGVALLLLAFFLNLFGFVQRKSWSYLSLNFAGASLSCYASVLIHFLPFIILEGTWAMVAAIGVCGKIFFASAK